MNAPGKEYYRNLITSEYRTAPRFNDMVRSMVDYGCELDRSILSIVEAFDVDTATGDILETIGECVGCTKTLSFEPSALIVVGLVCPTPSQMAADTEAESVYQVYQTPNASGMAQAEVISGYGPGAMMEESFIPEDVYRIMVKARIVQNVWKGNVPVLYEMWKNLFPDTLGLQIQDLQDMTFNIVLIGEYEGLMRELIMHGYIIPKPEGVRIRTLSFVSTDGLPIFSYDADNFTYSGYTSYWAPTTEAAAKLKKGGQ